MVSATNGARVGGESLIAKRRRPVLLPLLVVLLALHTCAPRSAYAFLAYDYYGVTCPSLESVVRSSIQSALSSDSRIAASLLRLHFHDCFVDGCDGSILLKDTSNFTGEQNATPNANSVRGFDVVDDIKSAVEAACSATVSCADILALAARDSVYLSGGPTYEVLLGRYDSFSASQSDANNGIPSPIFNVNSLTSSFEDVGLSQIDLVALSGAHTLGKASCFVVDFTGNSRLYNWSPNSDTTSGTGKPDPHMDPDFLASLQANCPQGGSSSALNNLDLSTPTTFDNSYFKNLEAQKGLLNSDQALAYQNVYTSELVKAYASDQYAFFNAFTTSILRMGSINPKTALNGEIRLQCGFPNSS